MNKRPLGKTGLQVSEVGLGGLFISQIGGPRQISIAAIHRALELGASYIDTAPAYADSERVIGEALRGRDEPLVLSTKLGGRPQPFDPRSRDCLLRSVEESLCALGRDRIDVLFIHEPDRPGEYDWWSDPEACYGPVMDVLEELKSNGTVRFMGLAGTTAYEMERLIRASSFDVVLTACNYSLLWREAELTVLAAARAAGMGIVAGAPLQQGALARCYRNEVVHGAPWLSPPRRRQLIALYDLVDEVGIPIAELALRFVLSNSDVSSVLVGARTPQEIESSVRAAERGPLDSGMLAALDEIAAMLPYRPFEEPCSLPLGRRYAGPGPQR